jgi:hypothetical protein
MAPSASSFSTGSNCKSHLSSVLFFSPGLEQATYTDCHPFSSGYSLYLIPGARAPLSRLHIGHESILLCYENGKARMWDLKSQELRRSMGVEVGLEGVEGKEGWIEL